MGMRIGNANAAGATQAAGFANVQQRQQGFKDLFAALQSGDLASAQKAYTTLTSGNSTINPGSALGKIGQALQNGDLAGAQQAGQDFQTMRSGRHHHHHQATAPASTGSTGSTGSTTAGTPGATGVLTGTNVNTTA